MITSLILSGITTASFADGKFVKFTYPVNKSAPSAITIKATGSHCIQSYNHDFTLSQGQSLDDEFIEDLGYSCSSRHQEIDYKIYNASTGKQVGEMDFYNPLFDFSHAFINLYLGGSKQQHTELPFSNTERKTITMNWG